MSDETVLIARDLAALLRGLARRFPRHVAVSRRLTAPASRVDRGKTLAVVGESGCGKSTLARIVTMIEPPTAGSLHDRRQGDRRRIAPKR